MSIFACDSTTSCDNCDPEIFVNDSIDIIACMQRLGLINRNNKKKWTKISNEASGFNLEFAHCWQLKITDKHKISDHKDLENLKKVFEAAANKIHISNDDKMNKFINKIYNNHKISILIQRPIEFLISAPLVALTYQRAALTFLLRTGRIREAAFSRLVGFPIGARIVRTMGGAFAAGAAMAGMELLIVLSKAQKIEIICKKPHIELKHTEMILNKTVLHIDTLTNVLEVLLTLELTKDQLFKAIEKEKLNLKMTLLKLL
ncbi:1436_t:CDS:2 [Gigaspora margarita]|uniref:1436_t:CDS:1 n=1 Tax=Gigaspora margarita TaxID=4874 RepID=A0ABN7UXT8_GIGMA|nr:1436_t:CDS:2 [Gigaspora margarita]